MKILQHWLLISVVNSFTLNLNSKDYTKQSTLSLSSPSDVEDPVEATSKSIEDLKNDLVDICNRGDISDKNFQVSKLVNEVEDAGKEMGVGQNSASSGLLSGTWNLIYASEDVTRSSPFFWAFRKAYGSDISSQIFSITDAIPSPIKDIGPATQEISLDNDNKGTLISQVKVATLQNTATSLMTTRCTVLGMEDDDTVRVRVDSTKPEESTILKKLGSLGEVIQANAPPFPSGKALEKAKEGSSEVLLQNTFCDENLRISRNKEGNEDFYVWMRDGFLGDFEI